MSHWEPRKWFAAGDARGYRKLSFLERRVIGHRVFWRQLRSRMFWRAVFVFLCLSTVLQIISWQHDLQGLQRDLLLCLPALLWAPFVAVARHRGIARILKED